MNVFQAAFCRVYQFGFRAAMPILPYREPEPLPSVERIPQKLRELGVSAALVVTDGGLRALGMTVPLEQAMARAGLACSVYDGTAANPTIANVEAALAAYRAGNCGAIVALGGGSSIDCAKALRARLAWPKRSVKRMAGNLRIWRKGPPLFAVPTTAGTGSEATVAAVLVDGETRHKFVMNDFSLIPDYAVLDPALTLGLPPFYTATTGMDAMTHAVEAYIGRSTTQQTRAWSVEAVRLIHTNLERAYRDGRDLEARGRMLRAAYLAGMSFTRSYVGYVHAVAHSLGGWYDTPHGLANSVLLPYVLRAYGARVYRPLKELAVAIGLADAATEPAVAAERFVRRLEEMNRNLGIPEKLRDIRAGDIEMLSRRADREGNPLYPVPRLMDARELRQIYAAAAENLNGEEH